MANLSIATDESYIDRNGSGERIDKTEWHRCVTFQDGLVDMLAEAREEGPPGLRRGQAADPASYRKNGEDSGPLLDGDPPGPRRPRAVPRQARRRQRQTAPRTQTGEPTAEAARCRPGPITGDGPPVLIRSLIGSPRLQLVKPRFGVGPLRAFSCSDLHFVNPPASGIQLAGERFAGELTWERERTPLLPRNTLQGGPAMSYISFASDRPRRPRQSHIYQGPASSSAS